MTDTRVPFARVETFLDGATSEATFPWAVSYALRMYPEETGRVVAALVKGIEGLGGRVQHETFDGLLALECLGRPEGIDQGWRALPDAETRALRLLTRSEGLGPRLGALGLVSLQGAEGALRRACEGLTSRDREARYRLLVAALQRAVDEMPVVDAALDMFEAWAKQDGKGVVLGLAALVEACEVDDDDLEMFTVPSRGDDPDSWVTDVLENLGESPELRSGMEWAGRAAAQGRNGEALGALLGVLPTEMPPGAASQARLAGSLLRGLGGRDELHRLLLAGKDVAAQFLTILVCLGVMVEDARVGATVSAATTAPETPEAGAASLVAVWERNNGVWQVSRRLSELSLRGEEEAAPVAEALGGLGPRLLRWDQVLDDLLEFLLAHPTERLLDLALDEWRAGDGPLACCLEVLLRVLRPEDGRLAEVAADARAWSQGSAAPDTAVLRLVCRGCGALHWYDVRHVTALDCGEGAPRAVVIDDDLACRSCGSRGLLEVGPVGQRLVRELSDVNETPRWLTRVRPGFGVFGPAPLEELQRTYEARRASRPGDRELELSWAGVLTAFGRNPESLAVVDGLLAETPGDAWLLVRRAQLLGRLGRHAEGLADVVAALLQGEPERSALVSEAGEVAALGRDLAAEAGTTLPAAALDAIARMELAVPEADRLPEVEPRAVKVGRNDPCPCGSGKKYKKCCLGVTSTAAAVPRPDLGVLRAKDAVIEGALALMSRQDWLEAAEAYLGRQVDEGEVAELMGGPKIDVYGSFVSWALFDWRRDGGPSVTERLLATAPPRRGLSGDERAVVASVGRGVRGGLVEVDEVDRRAGCLELRELVDGTRVRMRDSTLAGRAVRGDLALTRWFVHDGLAHGLGVLSLLPPRMRDKVTAHALAGFEAWRRGRNTETATWECFLAAEFPALQRWVEDEGLKPPRVLLSTGEEVRLGRARYAVVERSRLLAALEGSPCWEEARGQKDEDVAGPAWRFVLPPGEEAPWTRPLPEAGDDTVVMGCRRVDPSTMEGPEEDAVATVVVGEEVAVLWALSPERLAAGREVLEHLCPGAVSHERTTWVEPADLAKSGVPLPRADWRLDELNDQVFEAALRNWETTSVPALGGRSPREAAKRPEMRDALEGLLRGWENQEARAERGGRGPEACMMALAGLRRRLGMLDGGDES